MTGDTGKVCVCSFEISFGVQFDIPWILDNYQGISLKAAWKHWFKTASQCVSNPLAGGAEAKGFRVGAHDQKPTPALP
jgi:hypothetical protein